MLTFFQTAEGVLNDQGPENCDCFRGAGSARWSGRDGGCRTVRKYGRLRGLEEGVFGGGKSKRGRRLQHRGVDAGELCGGDYRRRPRPKKLRSVARSVSRQTRGL